MWHDMCRPTERRRPWQQQVVAQIAGVSLPLLTLSGASLGTQISLSSDNLPFGSVVLGSQVTVFLYCLTHLDFHLESMSIARS